MEEKVKCKNCTFEMIEEMAEDLKANIDCDYGGIYYRESAENLYTVGYRKIPEGSVVLTREEYEQDLTAQYDCGYEFGQKETAKEIYLAMIGEYASYIDTEIAKEIARKFGVEVEE